MTPTRKVVALALAFAAIQAALANFQTTRPFFFGRQTQGSVFADVLLYFESASKMFAGQVPYRDFPLEYPIAVLPIIAVPRLFAGDFESYKVALRAEMLLWNAAIVVMLARWVRREEGGDKVAGRLAWYTAVFCLSCPMLMARFDLAPTALAFAAAIAWASGRSGLGGGLAGAGVMLKIFPGAPVFPMLLGGRRGKVRGALVMALTIAAFAATWLVVGGRAVARSFGYHLERGLEVGSTYAGFAVVVSWLTGEPIRTATLHSSVEMVGRWPDRLAPLAFPLQLTAMGLVAWRYRRSGGANPLRYASAALLAFIAFGKVLSPQYLAWMFPFMAALRGRVGTLGRPIFLASVLATTLIYPWAFARMAALDGVPVVALLNIRNALLLILWAWLLLAPEEPGEANFREAAVL